MRGADLIAHALAAAGVNTIYSLSGNQIMPIYDACNDAGIRLIHTRHEGAAPYMADAHAQLTGGVGVAMITAAPGFASGLGPLYMARMAESPIILLSGDSPLSQDGMGAFQEMDQVAIAAPLCKHAFRPRNARDLGRDMALAVRIATSGRPGPVHVALPFDLLNEDVGDVKAPAAADFAPEATAPDEETVLAIVEALAAAERPVVLTGPTLNATRSRGFVGALADAVDAPVIPMESPRGLNDPSLGNFASVLAKADTIVVIAKKIDFTTGFGKPPAFAADAKVLVIDPETDVLERARRAFGGRLVLGRKADAMVTARAVAEAAAGRSSRAAWRHEMMAAMAIRTPVPAETGDGPMHPSVLCAAVQRLLDAADDPILIVDGGEFGQWAQACLSAPTRIINGPSGSIGGCLCYAVAAKIVRPGATVVVLMGDGTAGFHFAEFETAHRYGADFIAVIGHDSRWNAEYQIMLNTYGAERINECELNETRYDLAAAGFGCHGEHVEDPAELDAALARSADSGLPTCFVGVIEGLPAPAGSGH